MIDVGKDNRSAGSDQCAPVLSSEQTCAASDDDRTSENIEGVCHDVTGILAPPMACLAANAASSAALPSAIVQIGCSSPRRQARKWRISSRNIEFRSNP